MRYKVILNPVAGKGRALTLEPEVEKALKRLGVDFSVSLTAGVMDAAYLAECAYEEGFDAVIAAGGDGTCNEVINGLMRIVDRGETPPAFGVLPVGRGNDFSYGAGVPADFHEACTMIATLPPRPLDVGCIEGGFYPEGRYFGNGIGIGFDTMVGLEAAKLKHVHGFAAYVIGAVKTFLRFPPPPKIRLLFNDQEIQTRANQISILNGKRMGGTFFMAPDGMSDDGLLDLCMTSKALTRLEMAGLIIRYIKGTQAGHRAIMTERSAAFSITAQEGGVVCHADGETICTDGRHLDITLFPGALSIFAPPSFLGEHR